MSTTTPIEVTVMAKLTKAKLMEVKAALEDYLALLSEDCGLEFTVKGGTFNSVEANFGITARTEEGENLAELETSRYAVMVGLKPDVKGKTFEVLGREFMVVEIKPRRPKYPVVAEGEDGKLYKFSVRALPQHLRAQ